MTSFLPFPKVWGYDWFLIGSIASSDPKSWKCWKVQSKCSPPETKKNKYAAGVIFVNRCNLLPAAQLATSIGDFCDPFGWTCPWLTVGHTKGNMKRNPPWFWGITQCVAYNEFEWFPGKTSALLGFGVISWRLTLESIYTVGEFAVLVPECQWAVGGDLRVGSQLKSGAKRQCWRTTRIII